MKTIIRRLESKERWWAADVALRSLGALELGLCVLAVIWLYCSVHQPPAHEASAIELFAGLIAVQGWCVGTCLLVVGQGLFELIPLPGGFIINTRGFSR